MAESQKHRDLVLAIVEWIKKRNDGGREFIIFCDVAEGICAHRPHSIEGFIPDVYAVSRSGGRILIGEAKTITDVESRNSREQYKAYLRFCAGNDSAGLLLAVPWTMVNCAKGLIRSIQRQTNTGHVEVIFVEGLPE